MEYGATNPHETKSNDGTERSSYNKGTLLQVLHFKNRPAALVASPFALSNLLGKAIPCVYAADAWKKKKKS